MQTKKQSMNKTQIIQNLKNILSKTQAPTFKVVNLDGCLSSTSGGMGGGGSRGF